MMQLMAGVQSVTRTQDQETVESGMTRATLIFTVASDSFYLNPYDDVNQGPGEYSSKTIHAQGAMGKITQGTDIQK